MLCISHVQIEICKFSFDVFDVRNEKCFAVSSHSIHLVKIFYPQRTHIIFVRSDLELVNVSELIVK